MLKTARSLSRISLLLGDSIHIGIFSRLPGAIRYNRGTIATLWSALDLYGQTVQWMEWIVNLDFGRFRTQGILGVGATIRISI